MSALLRIDHVTTFRYARPVTFGEHRLMSRPRADHAIRVRDLRLEVAPQADVQWVQDLFSNSVALIRPQAPADTLRIGSHVTIRHEGIANLELATAPRAERWPFDYTAEERRDLGALLEPGHPDPDGRLHGWLHGFLRDAPRPRTRELLNAITAAVRSDFEYRARDAEGTQSPSETLERGSGTCRDFALLMIEALRRLRIAARFVSGYLYDPALDAADASPGATEVTGAGATHAWLQAYLPGAGWVPFDPTNAITGGSSLVRVAYARDPSQAAPLTGAWFGAADDFLGMDVDVRVTRLAGEVTQTGAPAQARDGGPAPAAAR